MCSCLYTRTMRIWSMTSCYCIDHKSFVNLHPANEPLAFHYVLLGKKRNKCVTSNSHLHVKQEHSESPTLPEGPDFTSLNQFELITNGMINNNLYSTIVTKTCMNFITRTKFVSSTQINLVFSIWLWLAQSTKGFNELVYIG